MTAIRRSLAGVSCARCTSHAGRVVALWSRHQLVRWAGRLNACESAVGIVVGDEEVARQTTKPAPAQNARRLTPRFTSSSSITTPSPRTSCTSKSLVFLCDNRLLTPSRCSSVRLRVLGGATSVNLLWGLSEHEHFERFRTVTNDQTLIFCTKSRFG